VLKTRDVRFIVSNEYEFMDYKEVVAEFKRTPKSMRMKPVKVTGRSGAESVAYLVPDTKKRRLRIETIEGVRCEDHVLGSHARAFSSQGKRILDHLAKTMLANASMTNLDRLPSKVALQQRVGQASTPSNSCASTAPRRKDRPRGRSEAGDAADDDDDEDAVDYCEAEGEEEDKSDAQPDEELNDAGVDASGSSDAASEEEGARTCTPQEGDR
jgi:hypothetical protein